MENENRRKFRNAEGGDEIRDFFGQNDLQACRIDPDVLKDYRHAREDGFGKGVFFPYDQDHEERGGFGRVEFFAVLNGYRSLLEAFVRVGRRFFERGKSFVHGLIAEIESFVLKRVPVHKTFLRKGYVIRPLS